MKQLITCFLLSCFPAYGLNAQVCPPKSAANTSTEPDTASVYYPEPDLHPVIDLNNLGRLVEKEQKRVVQFGYGINNILRMDQNQRGNWLSADLSWFDDRPAHVFDFSVGLDSRASWLLGFSFGFQKLGELNRSETFRPEEHVQGPSDFGTLPLDVKFQLKAATYAPLLYTEYRILNPWKGFSAFGRAEMGMTIYRSAYELTYRDSCDCTKIPASDWEMSAAFTAGLGLGVKWEYRFVGLKALLSYQFQTKVNFKERDEYLAYSFGFNPVDYDFKGEPENNRFTIQKAGEDLRRGYNPLYLQLMLYFRFGRLH